MARPKVHDEKLRARLLERAGKLVSDGGADALSLRILARDCETSTTAVYALFGGKNGLLTALFDEAFEHLGRRIGALTPSADPLEDLVRTAWPTARARSPTRTCSRSCSPVPRCCPPRRRAATVAGTALGPLRAAALRAVEEKALRADADTALVSLTLWTTVHGWVALQLRGYLPPNADDRCADAVRAVLAGWSVSRP